MGSAALHRNREFMLLWGGQTFSELGSQISLVAYPLLVLALTGSPAKAGLVGFARALPIAVLSLPAGALVDRVNRKLVMVACDGVRALSLAALSISLALGSAPYALIIAVALVEGSAFVFAYVAERGALRHVVAPEHLSEAVARNESRLFVAMLAGPPLGGLLFGLGRAIPFVVDAISYVVSSVSTLLIRSSFQEARAEEGQGDLAEGLRWIWRRPFLRGCALLFAGSNPVFTGLYLLVVVLARRHGASSLLIGTMLAIAAAGGLLGAMLAPRLQRILAPRLVLLGEAWVMALAVPLLLVFHNALLLGLVLATAELITPVSNSIVVSFRVGLAPDRLQGRVQAAATLITFSAGWAGPLVVGLLLQHAGLTATVLALTGWVLLLAVGATIAPAFRHPPTLGGPEAECLVA